MSSRITSWWRRDLLLRCKCWFYSKFRTNWCQLLVPNSPNKPILVEFFSFLLALTFSPFSSTGTAFMLLYFWPPFGLIPIWSGHLTNCSRLASYSLQLMSKTSLTLQPQIFPKETRFRAISGGCGGPTRVLGPELPPEVVFSRSTREIRG